MRYKMTVKEFIEKSKSGEIDYIDFATKALELATSQNEMFNFFQCLTPFTKKIDIEPCLYGLPISVKDNICVKGVQSCAGSKILEGYIPPFDATAVANIKAHGGRIIGKTNQDEFGFGTFSTNCAFGVPKNPLDPERSCGGSSGGAAGFTAAFDYPHIALAESTGGSISCPASFCGVVGLTPTYGLVSRYGLIDYANSLDKIGIISKSVWDAALGLSIIAGHDPKDSTSLKTQGKDYTKLEKNDLNGIKIGVPKEYFVNVTDEIEKHVWSAIKKAESLGATYQEVSLPNTRYALSSYYIIAMAEASTNLAKFCGMRYGAHQPLEGNFNEYFSKVRSKFFGEEAKRRIILGTFARMSGYRDAYYLKAMKVRTLIIQEFKKVFQEFDCLFAPTMPILPPKFVDIDKLTPAQQYQMDVLTVPPNLAGIPMISIPCGKIAHLPVGLHIIADHLQEEKLLNIASVLESEMKKF